MHLFSLTLLAGCGWFEQPVAPPVARPSLVLVTLDTTRWDRIGAYGYDKARTPTLDRLAREGARFDRAYSVVPLTTPSHSSMLTGLYPTRHGVRTNGDATLPAELTTLAERLRTEGYRTGASVSAFVTTRMWGLDQGFDAYFDTLPAMAEGARSRWGQERPADQVVDDAIGWLAEGGDEPFFLWVHLYDAHEPYAPPRKWAEALPGRPYDGEIAFVDEQVGRLREAVDARAPGRAAWIAIADHGEALSADEPEHTHGLFLFDGTMRIPFIVRPATPLAEPRVVHDVTVSNVDVTPTALGLLGLAPLPDVDGSDLTPAIRGEAMVRDAVYMESLTASQRFGYHPEVAVAEGSLKLMDTPNARLFDLAADPREKTNLVAERPSDVTRLRAVAEAVIAATVARTQSGAVPADVVEQLAALGYVGAGAASDPKFDSPVDAKDKNATIRALERARALSRKPETVDDAVRVYREILAEEPQLGEALLALALTLEKAGKRDEAITLMQETLKLTPESTVLHTNLAALLARERRFAEALVEMEASLALVPTDPAARVGVLRMMLALRRGNDALARGRTWLAEPGRQPGVQAVVGLLLADGGDLAEAEPLLRASLEGGAAQPRVHEVLARLALSRDDTAAAEEHIRLELETSPTNAAARWARANLLMSRQAWDEAADELRFIVETEPTQHAARVRWAQAVFNAGDYDLAAQILAPARIAAPDDPRAMILDANLLSKQGRKAEAEPLARKAQALARAGGAARPPGTGERAEDPFGEAPVDDAGARAGEVAPTALPQSLR